MTNQGRRIATATSFLSGVITCLDAMRDASISWPPDAVWEVLSRPKRLELCGGIALILVTLVITIVRARSD